MKITKYIVVAAAAVSFGLSPAARADSGKTARGFNESQKKDIRKLVRDYLMKHPEVVIEAMREYQRRQREKQLQAARAAIKDNRNELLRDKDSVVAGNPKGDITIVEFFDYRCGYCKRVKAHLDLVVKNDPNVRVVYKEFPILGPASTYASRAAIASRKQGDDKYRAYHDALMAARDVNPASVLAIAKQVGLDTAKLTKDMNDPKVGEIIRRNHELAEKLGIRGTPAFVIGNEMVPGAIGAAQFAAKLAQARAACKKDRAPVC